MGLTNDRYAFRLQDLGQCVRFLLIKPSGEFAFFVQLPMWFDHVRSSVKKMPGKGWWVLSLEWYFLRSRALKKVFQFLVTLHSVLWR